VFTCECHSNPPCKIVPRVFSHVNVPDSAPTHTTFNPCEPVSSASLKCYIMENLNCAFYLIISKIFLYLLYIFKGVFLFFSSTIRRIWRAIAVAPASASTSPLVIVFCKVKYLNNCLRYSI
jgi:hypothetical protein